MVWSVLRSHYPPSLQLMTQAWWRCRWPSVTRSSPTLWCLSTRPALFLHCHHLSTTGSHWMVRLSSLLYQLNSCCLISGLLSLFKSPAAVFILWEWEITGQSIVALGTWTPQFLGFGLFCVSQTSGKETCKPYFQLQPLNTTCSIMIIVCIRSSQVSSLFLYFKLIYFYSNIIYFILFYLGFSSASLILTFLHKKNIWPM